MSLILFSEPYQAGGSINAKGAAGAIGRPRLSPWELFIREALQNSWDARKRQKGPIRFSVDLVTVTPGQRQALVRQVFGSTPDPKHLMLRQVLHSKRSLHMLVVTDQGTHGLCGPTRADRQVHERTDFVDFARNVGRASGRQAEGGTYGLGKGVLFAASGAGTVLSYSRTTNAGLPVTRLFGIALGNDYSFEGARYTGRHFWGISDHDTGVDPLEGPEADALAASVGLGRLAGGTETGTALAVLDPIIGADAEPRSILEQIVEGLLWSAWPHMVAAADGPPVVFEVTHNGAHLPIPDPASHPTLKHFVSCYRRAESISGGRTLESQWPYIDVQIRSQRPAQTLGQLVYRMYPAVGNGTDQDRPSPTSHVALMRNPRFVVKYLPVAADRMGQSTAGVFIADRERDAEFARSEPVAHEDWLPESLRLQKYARNPVKQALDKIAQEFRRQDRVDDAVPQTEANLGTVRLSGLMGDLVSGVGGDNADGCSGKRGTGGRSTGRARRLKVSVENAPFLRMEDGAVVCRFTASYKAAAPTESVVRLIPRVRVDGGAPEGDDRPAGAEVPVVVATGPSEGDCWPGEEPDIFHVVGPKSGSFWIDVRQPVDTVVSLELEVVSEL